MGRSSWKKKLADLEEEEAFKEPSFSASLGGEQRDEGDPWDRFDSFEEEALSEEDEETSWQRPHARSRGGLPSIESSLLTLAAGLGLFASAVSTEDFISHLDRQVHAVRCSVFLGSGASFGESGCRTAMKSANSSWFRSSFWGGLPVSLLSLGVFAFFLYRGLVLMVRRRTLPGEGLFLFVGALLPALMSTIYASLSLSTLGTICSTCAFIYLASAITLLAGVLLWRKESRSRSTTSPRRRKSALPSRFALGIGEGVTAVLLFVGLYILNVPERSLAAGESLGCAALAEQSDPHRIMLTHGRASAGAVGAVEVIDPLCPACRSFESRLEESGLATELRRQLVLFPLDTPCNWMLSEPLHPGACEISQAMLCAPSQSEELLEWAFNEQERLVELAKRDRNALVREIERRAPSVRGCLNRREGKRRLSKSLRWAARNALPVMTPQLFVGGRALCDEDTDLGLEYTLTQLIQEARQ
ncbi:MAG: vitamin K epoxide reductase family protein [Myxococcota bacterium]|nr:vitamin K epoxide reductase family protein [Myxococcota bacterium]